MTLFPVLATTHYERLSAALTRQQPSFEEVEKRARATLATDPYNRTRLHNIKKLENVPAGDGQWRLAIGRFRFRYDFHGRSVVLKRCSLRREDTYR